MASPAPETAPAAAAGDGDGADVTVPIKWNGAALEVSLPPTADVAGLKRALEARTSVLAKKQRLLGLKTRAGSAATDATRLSELAVAKPIMLMGTAEAAHAAVAAMEVAPHVQGLADDLDDDLDGAAAAAAAARDEVEARLRRRVGAAVIREHQPPRPGHKAAVFDVDYTFFALDTVAENPADLRRPGTHELFAALYANGYDVIIWSATGHKWIEAKLRETGVSSHPAYKITACMDYTAMVTLPAPPGHKRATYDCKPLRVLWERYPGVYTPENTVMVDDLRRNYVLNPQNGLVCRPFKKAHTRGRGDRELHRLKHYLLKIAPLESLAGLDHDRWEHYARREIRAAEAAEAAEGGGGGGGEDGEDGGGAAGSGA